MADKIYPSQKVAEQIAAKKTEKTGEPHTAHLSSLGWVVQAPEKIADTVVNAPHVADTPPVPSVAGPFGKKKPIVPVPGSMVKPKMSDPMAGMFVYNTEHNGDISKVVVETGHFFVEPDNGPFEKYEIGQYKFISQKQLMQLLTMNPTLIKPTEWKVHTEGNTVKFTHLPTQFIYDITDVSDNVHYRIVQEVSLGAYTNAEVMFASGKNAGQHPTPVQAHPEVIKAGIAFKAGGYHAKTAEDKAEKKGYVFKVPYDMILGETSNFYTYLDVDNPTGGMCYLAKTSVIDIDKDIITQTWVFVIRPVAFKSLKLWKYYQPKMTNEWFGDMPIPSQYIIYQGEQPAKLPSPSLPPLDF